jgi:hypothetical protein
MQRGTKISCRNKEQIEKEDEIVEQKLVAGTRNKWIVKGMN